jgi:hypothetical protein
MERVDQLGHKMELQFMKLEHQLVMKNLELTHQLQRMDAKLDAKLDAKVDKQDVTLALVTGIGGIALVGMYLSQKR